MKKALKALIVVAIAFSSVFASDSIINYLNASSNGDRIKIEWKSNDEVAVQKYEIERTSKNQVYTKISDIDAKGYSTSYSYYDESALKQKNEDLQSATLYSYRIKIIQKDKSVSYSNVVNVSHATSGIKRTWGMIKEMFR